MNIIAKQEYWVSVQQMQRNGRRERTKEEKGTTEAYLLGSSSLYNDDRRMSGLLIWFALVGVETLGSPWQMYFNCLGACASLGTKLLLESMCSKREHNNKHLFNNYYYY